MIDLVKLTLIAGNGGHGRVSFRREKYVPKGGPDGGNGGDGGSIILRGNKGLNTLKQFSHAKKMKAEDGEFGGGRKKWGPKGEDIVIEVPIGTVVWLLDENEISLRRRKRIGLEHIFKRADVRFEKYYLEKEGQRIPEREEDKLSKEMDGETNFDQDVSETKKAKQALMKMKKEKLIEVEKDGQEIVLCQGGFSGRGNDTYKSSVNQVPLEADYGTFGEIKEVIFELRLLADVGLVGFPNAGKSTLLSKVTKAHPKIANYPFTTIEPNLGIMDVGIRDKKVKEEDVSAKTSLIMADLPGLIEGASEGKGLGHDFLRHVEHCSVLLYVLYLDENVVFDESLSNGEKAKIVWKQYQDLKKELEQYEEEKKKWMEDSDDKLSDLLSKPYVLSLNKIDIYTKELIDAISKLFTKKDEYLMSFSGVTGEGLDELKKKLFEVVEK